METTSNETTIPAKPEDVTEHMGVKILLVAPRMERIDDRKAKHYGAWLLLHYRLDGVRDRNISTEAAIVAHFDNVMFRAALDPAGVKFDRVPTNLGKGMLEYGEVDLYGNWDYSTGTLKLRVDVPRPKDIPADAEALLAMLRGAPGAVGRNLRDELLTALRAAIDTADDQKTRERDARSATLAGNELLSEARKIARERIGYAERRKALEDELNAAEVDAVHALTLETQAKCDASGTYTQEDGVTIAPRVIAAALKHAAKCITGGFRPAFGREWDEVRPEEL